MALHDLTEPSSIETGLGAVLEYRGLRVHERYQVTPAVPAFVPTDIAGLEMWLKADAIVGLNDGDPVTTWEDSSPGNRDANQPLFAPSDIAGLQLWLRGDDAAPYGDGNPVPDWADATGSLHALQATGANQPILKNNILDGHSVIRFDGVNDFMSVAGITNNDPTRTIFIVAKSDGGVQKCVWSFTGMTAKVNRASGTNQWEYTASQAGAGQSLGGDWVNWSAVTVRYNSSASLDAYLNGGAATSFDPDDSFQSGAGAAAFLIGAADAIPSQPFDGDVAEVIVFNSALSESDRLKVLGYLSRKYPTLGSFGTGDKRPTYKTNIINGKPAIRFDGTDDTMQVAGIANDDPDRTMFIVAKQAASTGGRRVFNLSDINSGGINSQGSQWGYAQQQGGGDFVIGGNPAVFQVVTVRWNNAASADTYINGAAAVNLNPGDQYQNGGGVLNLGGTNQTTDLWNGDIVEVIIFNTALSDADRLKVLGYLSNKYPILGSFGTGVGGSPQIITPLADLYRLMRIDGVSALPDIRDSRETNPSDHGETAYESFYGGRSIVLDGRIEAGDLNKMRAMTRELKAAFGQLDDDWLYFRIPTDPTRDSRILCRTTSFSLGEAQENQEYRRNFQITLRAAEPFVIADSPTTGFKLLSDVTVLGRFYDRTYDLVYGTYMDSNGYPLTNVNPFELTNNGNFEARPVITIFGPVTDPSIINLTNGQQLKMDVVLAAGDYLVVDVAARTIRDSLGNNRYSLRDPSSDWLVLEPGPDPNVIQMTGSSFSGGAGVQVEFNDTWL